MKVKMISRNPDQYVRETKLQNHRSMQEVENTKCFINKSYLLQCQGISILNCIPWKRLENMFER